MTDDDPGVVERARRRAAEAARRAPLLDVVTDPAAAPEDRARAYLDTHPGDSVWIVADSQARASRWAKDAGVGGARWVQVAANLHGVTDGFVVVLPGAANHRDWRRLARRLAALRGVGEATIVVVDDDHLDGDPVGSVVLHEQSIAALPARPGQGDVLFFRDSRGTIIAQLDREAVNRLVVVATAFLNAEAAPDPDAEEKARIRREILAAGDPFARGGNP